MNDYPTFLHTQASLAESEGLPVTAKKFQAAATEMEQLQATNTELPKLADGVLITRALINRDVWVVRCHNNTDNPILRIVVIEIKIMEHDVELTGRDEYGVERKVEVEYCYSTLKAAKQARENDELK